MATGTVRHFDPQRGFGFISRVDGDDLFVHRSQIVGDGLQVLEVGQSVKFEIGPSRKGGDEARNVTAI